MRTLFYFYIFVLIAAPLFVSNNSFHVQKPSPLPAPAQKLINKFHNPQLAQIMIKYLTGGGGKIPKEIKKIHQQTGTLHLFTPSGLHFQTLFSCVKLLKFIPSIRSYFPMLVLVMFAFLLYLPKLFALKRVACFKTLQVLVPQSSPFILFSLSFVADILMGNTQASPWSFILSLLFWGPILIYTQKGELSLFWVLLCSNIISAYIFKQTLFVSALFLNIPLTLLFCLLYPIWSFAFWTQLPWHAPILESTLKIFLWIQKHLLDILPQAFWIPDLFSITVILILLAPIPFKKALLLLCLFIPQALEHPQEEGFSISSKRFCPIPLRPPTRIRYHEKSYRSFHDAGVMCQHKFWKGKFYSFCTKKSRSKERPFIKINQ